MIRPSPFEMQYSYGNISQRVNPSALMYMYTMLLFSKMKSPEIAQNRLKFRKIALNRLKLQKNRLKSLKNRLKI